MRAVSDLGIELIDGDRGHEYPKDSDFASKGFCLFLSAQNVTPDGFRFEDTQFITESKHRRLRKGTVDRDDIVVTTRGTLGNFAYYDDSVPFDVMRINSGMVIIRNGDQQLATPFLYEMLRSALTERQIALNAYGSAQPQLNLSILARLQVVVPSQGEQVILRDLISAVIARLSKEEGSGRKLRTLKHGLMDDLLTGRVRVTIPEEAAP